MRQRGSGLAIHPHINKVANTLRSCLRICLRYLLLPPPPPLSPFSPDFCFSFFLSSSLFLLLPPSPPLPLLLLFSLSIHSFLHSFIFSFVRSPIRSATQCFILSFA